MKIVMDRNYCDAALSFCAECSAAFFQKPQGTDPPVLWKSWMTVTTLYCTLCY